MSEDGFDISELEDFEKQLLEARDDFPKVTEKFMRSEAGKLRNRMVKRAKTELKEDTGTYIKGFKKGKKVYEYGDVKFNVRAYNSAPYAYQIEHGHRIVGHRPDRIDTGKKSKAYHIVENAGLEFRTQFYKDVETILIKKIKEEVEK